MYILFTQDWDYKRIQVHLSLPGYTKKSLNKFGHKQQKKQKQPYPSVPINYGAKINMPRNHHWRHFLKKRERDLFNKCTEKFVSRKSIRHDPAVPNQRHRITIRESDRGNNETNTTTVRLHRDVKRNHNNIQPKRHETCSPQQCELPRRTKSKKSSRLSLIFIQRSNNTTKQRRDY